MSQSSPCQSNSRSGDQFLIFWIFFFTEQNVYHVSFCFKKKMPSIILYARVESFKFICNFSVFLWRGLNIFNSPPPFVWKITNKARKYFVSC